MKGYIGDILYVGIFLAFLVLASFTWFTVSPQLATILNTPDVTQAKSNTDISMFTFDSWVPILLAGLELAVIFAFAVLPLSRAYVFMFAFVFIFMGIVLQMYDQLAVQMFVLINNAVPMPNLLSSIAQVKLLAIVGGLVMLLIGFTRGTK